MNDFTRFQLPIQSIRPRGARLIEAFSIKLGRRLQCYGNLAFNLWILLETDPSVESFCERPTHLEFEDCKRLADYWIKRKSQEEFLVIDPSILDLKPCPSTSKVPIRIITLSDLSAARVWINNWQRLLPIIIASREHISPSLERSITKFIKEPMQLARIEREFVTGDPTLIRAALFHLLHKGILEAPSLHVEPLSFLTYFEPSGG